MLCCQCHHDHDDSMMSLTLTVAAEPPGSTRSIKETVRSSVTWYASEELWSVTARVTVSQ
eukprot:3592071-Rhodomonas_salina.1